MKCKTYIYLAVFLASLLACKKTGMDMPCSDDPCATNACSPEECDIFLDSTFMGLDTLWATAAGVITGNIQNVAQSSDQIFINLILLQGHEVLSFDKNNGDLLWRFNNPEAPYFSDMHFHKGSQRLVLQSDHWITSVNALTGEMISDAKPEGYSASASYGSLIGDYYYMPVRLPDESAGYVLKSHVTDLIEWDEVYEVKKSQVDGNRPSINSMNQWIHPETSDEILLLQHRMAFPRRIDLVAYNMTADSMYWWHKDIEPAGNSNIGQIGVVDGRAIFQGSEILHCFDIKTGELQWSIDGRPDRGYMTAFSNIVDLKNGNIIVTVRDVSDPSTTSEYITQKINLEDGNILRELHIHTGYVNRVYKNGYLFGSGRERIVNINSGWSYWSEVDNNNLGIYDILVDEDRQLYYGIYGGIVQDDARLMAWDISDYLD